MCLFLFSLDLDYIQEYLLYLPEYININIVLYLLKF